MAYRVSEESPATITSVAEALRGRISRKATDLRERRAYMSNQIARGTSTGLYEGVYSYLKGLDDLIADLQEQETRLRTVIADFEHLRRNDRAHLEQVAAREKSVETSVGNISDLRPGTRVIVRLDPSSAGTLLPADARQELRNRYLTRGATELVATVQSLDPMNAGVFLGNLEMGGGTFAIPKSAIVRRL
jgi:hypothetical protein